MFECSFALQLAAQCKVRMRNPAASKTQLCIFRLAGLRRDALRTSHVSPPMGHLLPRARQPRVWFCGRGAGRVHLLHGHLPRSRGAGTGVRSGAAAGIVISNLFSVHSSILQTRFWSHQKSCNLWRASMSHCPYTLYTSDMPWRFLIVATRSAFACSLDCACRH